MYEKFKAYLIEVKQEFEKVSWPTREELITSTIVVILFSIVLAFFIGGVDALLLLGTNALFAAR